MRKSLITLVDTHQRITVFVVMTTGGICPADEDRVDVTMNHVINCETEHVFVNRVYESIVRLEDDGESAWPDADGCTWLANEVKVDFFVLAYLLSGCDSCPQSKASRSRSCGRFCSRLYEQRDYSYLSLSRIVPADFRSTVTRGLNWSPT